MTPPTTLTTLTTWVDPPIQDDGNGEASREERPECGFFFASESRGMLTASAEADPRVACAEVWASRGKAALDEMELSAKPNRARPRPIHGNTTESHVTHL